MTILYCFDMAVKQTAKSNTTLLCDIMGIPLFKKEEFFMTMTNTFPIWHLTKNGHFSMTKNFYATIKEVRAKVFQSFNRQVMIFA